jgi:GNAT superfamily N-acetyltransferase
MEPTYFPVPIRIESFSGARSDLLPLFEMADDSADQIRNYIELGEVLVARYRQHIMGHVQVLSGAAEREIKSIAVLGEYRGHGIGSALIRAACNQALAERDLRIAVATATADIGNLRFYQRLGFRMVRIEQDAFSKEKGYSSVTVDGIPVRDKVWLSIDLEDIASSRP